MVGHKGLLYLLYGTDADEPVGGDDHLIRVITPGGDVVKDFDVGHSTRPLDMQIFEDHIYVLAAIWTRFDDDDDDDGDDDDNSMDDEVRQLHKSWYQLAVHVLGLDTGEPTQPVFRIRDEEYAIGSLEDHGITVDRNFAYIASWNGFESVAGVERHLMLLDFVRPP